MDNCIVCEERFHTFQNLPNDTLRVECDVCGTYKTVRTVATTGLSRSKYPPHIRAGIVRSLNNKGVKVVIDSENFDRYADNIVIPQNPIDKIEHLLLYIAENTQSVFNGVELDWDHDWAVCFANGADELRFYIQKSIELGYIETLNSSSTTYRLDIEGWRYIKQLKQNRISTNQAFVAMWFDNDLVQAWEDGFKPALEQVGYSPIRIDMVSHNEDINDRIIAEIRKSSLMIADFTGQRNGVYFEAGFAMGLDIPLIRTCREDQIDELHFDTEHYFHLRWSTPEDLRETLKTHIRATIPGVVMADE